jgi:hypothetical protein
MFTRESKMQDYFEVVISGSFLYVKGLITGICIGAGKNPSVIFNKERKIESETMGEMLKEFVGLSDILVHVIVPDDLLDFVKGTLSHKDAYVKIKSVKKIISANFEFDFQAYSEKQKNEIKAIFDNPPCNLSYSKDTKFHENIDNNAKGVEIYTPAHNYEYFGKGKVEGTFPEIFDLFKKCDVNSLIDVSKMHLKF